LLIHAVYEGKFTLNKKNIGGFLWRLRQKNPKVTPQLPKLKSAVLTEAPKPRGGSKIVLHEPIFNQFHKSNCASFDLQLFFSGFVFPRR
jgi:hypothetical protein